MNNLCEDGIREGMNCMTDEECPVQHCEGQCPDCGWFCTDLVPGSYSVELMQYKCGTGDWIDAEGNGPNGGIAIGFTKVDHPPDDGEHSCSNIPSCSS